MARIRTIKPQFFLNEDLAELPFEFRLLFIGLWTQADRDGRLEDRPIRLKAQLFPYDTVDIEKGLTQLCKVRQNSVPLITRYEHDGHKYIQINGFTKHQRPHIREDKSEIPPPPRSKSTA